MTEKDPLTEFENKYKLFKSYIDTEGNLVNNRITWMLTIHGFLYATYGFTLQKIMEINEKIASKGNDAGYCDEIKNAALMSSVAQALLFLACICCVGFFISLVAHGSIGAAHRAIASINTVFEHYKNPISFKEEANHVDLRKYGMDFNKIKVYKVLGKESKWIIPTLTGGGYPSSHDEGYNAANLIPVVLMIGWGVSFIALGFEVFFEIMNFYSGDKCLCLKLLNSKLCLDL